MLPEIESGYVAVVTPPVPQGALADVRSPPILACTQFPEVNPETERAVVEAYGKMEAVVLVAWKWSAFTSADQPD